MNSLTYDTYFAGVGRRTYFRCKPDPITEDTIFLFSFVFKL